MRVVCIVQARVGSTRLPNKVLKKVCGKTILEHDVDRLRQVSNIDEIVIATTTKDEDMRIIKECEKLGVKTFRGSEDNVLSRYYLAAKEYKADIVVRVTSDCPVIDADVTYATIKYLTDNLDKYDYVSNSLIKSFPRGLDTEVFTFESLEKTYKEATLNRDKEHVTPYMYVTRPDLFRVGKYAGDIDYSELRWTVDTPEDFELIKTIYEMLYNKHGNKFKMKDILGLYGQHPELCIINRDVEQKKLEEN